MGATQRPVTYDDLLQMHDDGVRREVLGGELIVTPALTAGHQRVVGRFFRPVDDLPQQHGGEVFPAPFDVLLGHYNVVQPDLVYVSPQRSPVPGDHHLIDYPPDLVVEVVSPGTGGIDRVRKMALYASARMPEYWIADPVRKSFVVNVPRGEECVAAVPDEDGRVASNVLPGFRINVARLFAGLG
jgi:Uma2 family endonuclease